MLAFVGKPISLTTVLTDTRVCEDTRQTSLEGIGVDEHLWFQALRESESDSAYEAQADGSLGISGHFGFP